MAPRIPLSADLYKNHRAEIEAALNEAVRDALLDHKRAGNPIAVWRDGKVVIIPANEIPVDDPLTNGAHQNQNDAEQRAK
jgi:hypothetical protein